MKGEIYTEARRLAELYLDQPRNCIRVEWFAFDRTPAVWLPFDTCVLREWNPSSSDGPALTGPCVARVDALSPDKYYGSTVTACGGKDELPPEGRSAALRWTIWDMEYPDPSDRQCDALGIPHGTTVAEANSRYDEYLEDCHHETELTYRTCYLFAQMLRGNSV